MMTCAKYRLTSLILLIFFTQVSFAEVDAETPGKGTEIIGHPPDAAAIEPAGTHSEARAPLTKSPETAGLSTGAAADMPREMHEEAWAFRWMPCLLALADNLDGKKSCNLGLNHHAVSTRSIPEVRLERSIEGLYYGQAIAVGQLHQHGNNNEST